MMWSNVSRSVVSRSLARGLGSLALVALTLVVGANAAFAQPASPATHAGAATLQAPRALQKAHADMKHLPVGTITLTYNTVSRVLRSNVTLQGLQPNSTVIVETVQNNCSNPAGVTHRFADMTADANGKALNFRTRINNVAGFPPTNRAVEVLSQPLPNAPLQLACVNVKVPNRGTDPNTLEPTLTETLTFGPTADVDQNVSGTADLNLDGTTLTVNVQAYNLQPNSTATEAIHLGSCTWLSYVLYDLPPLQADGNGHASSSMTILNVQQGIPNTGWYVGVNYSPTNDSNNSRTVSCGNVNLLLVWQLSVQRRQAPPMLSAHPLLFLFSSSLAAAAAPPYTADTMEPALRAWLAVITIIVLLGVLFVVLRYWRRGLKPSVIWTMSIATSTLLALGIVAIWTVVSTMPVALNVGKPLLTEADVGAALRASPADKENSIDQPAPILVPTGVYIRTIQFTGPHNLLVSGEVWQNYPLETPDDVDRGVALPDATSTTFTEVSRTPQSNGTLIRWNFTANLRQIFVYDRYPLDRQDIWLRMRPAETETPVVLTPDLSAYPSITPSTKPGLTLLPVLEGWYPVQTYFSYATTAANTTFGDERGAREAQFPELYYTVTVKRDLLPPFLTYLFPLLITATLLFFALLITTRELERRTQIGWNVAGILAYCGSLLFIALLAHINLRSAVGADGLLYIGDFYFTFYALILLALLDAMLLLGRTEARWITLSDNLIPKALYWPIYLGFIFLLTVVTFAV